MIIGKLNSLPPTLREKQRYLVFEIISKKEFELGEVVSSIWNASLQTYGEVGVSSFSLWIPGNLYDKAKKKGIVKCNHTSVEQMRSVLATIKEIEGDPVCFKVTGVTGTIKSAKNKFMGMKTLEEFAV